MSEERRVALVAAVEAPDGFARLRELVKSYLDDGVADECLLEGLSQIRSVVDEPTEDRVLDVMDLIAGWCAPEYKFGRGNER